MKLPHVIILMTIINHIILKSKLKFYYIVPNSCLNSIFFSSNVIIKSKYITHESFDIDAVNVPDIETEKDDRNTGMQNSILIIEDLVKKEFDIKEEMLTSLNNDIEK